MWIQMLINLWYRIFPPDTGVFESWEKERLGAALKFAHEQSALDDEINRARMREERDARVHPTCRKLEQNCDLGTYRE